MARNLIAALDVGTSTVQTVVAEKKKGEETLRILGIGMVPSVGIRRGVVVDLEDAASSIRKSVAEAQRAAGVPVRSVWLNVGGSHISVSSSRGVVAVSRADGEISPEDVRRAIAAAETFIPKNPNKEILHMIPRDFKVDHEAGIKDPVGMHGVRLEVDTLIIECSAPFLKNLFKCVEGAGLRVEDYVFSPLAAADAVLTKRQKELGVMLLDLGGGTASFMIFEEGVPIHAGVIPIGGNHITNDVAIGFRTHVDVAERIKTTHGSCLPSELPKRDTIRLAEFIPDEAGQYSRKELAEIIEARLRDIFELLQKELKKVDRAQLLPAGIVLVGGSVLMPGIVELTKRELKLPTEIGCPEEFLNSIDDKVAPAFVPVLGLAKWAGTRVAESRSILGGHRSSGGEGTFIRWLRSLLP
ncbi:MAG: cell division protein FtsA [Candidatus Sungiibacteriota bacterium]|uniref:Cell division protein FtsA n=1 Tax=Candidatus Sungiibacteriota bacterium TaxID=2750080 RepID=A0A7T5UQB2_9BACT|nr:MAG: cell division protein FtsA [Candidatus Sungbacteria bacterium]